MTWNKIRWVFPVIFFGIIAFQLYGYSFPKKRWSIERIFTGDAPQNMIEPPRDELSEIENEFKTLFNVLDAQASKRKMDPPDNLARALALAGTVWPGPKAGFTFALQYLLDPKYKGNDPWGQPFVYLVDTKEQRISLHSFGPNGENDDTMGDDIYVARKYDKSGRTISENETNRAVTVESNSTNNLLAIALVPAVAATAGFFALRRIYQS